MHGGGSWNHPNSHMQRDDGRGVRECVCVYIRA